MKWVRVPKAAHISALCTPHNRGEDTATIRYPNVRSKHAAQIGHKHSNACGKRGEPRSAPFAMSRISGRCEYHQSTGGAHAETRLNDRICLIDRGCTVDH